MGPRRLVYDTASHCRFDQEPIARGKVPLNLSLDEEHQPLDFDDSQVLSTPMCTGGAQNDRGSKAYPHHAGKQPAHPPDTL